MPIPFMTLQVAWLIEEFVEDARVISDQILRVMGTAKKARSPNVGPFDWIDMEVVRDDTYYYVDLTLSFKDKAAVQALLGTMRIPFVPRTITVVVPGSPGVAVGWGELPRTVSVRAVLDKPLEIVTVKVLFDSVETRWDLRVDPELYADAEKRYRGLRAVELVNKAEEMYKAAESEWKALQKLWEAWWDDKEPTCKLAAEIWSRYLRYVEFSNAWKSAFLDALNYVRQYYPEIRPPKERPGLPVIRDPAQWPAREWVKNKSDAYIETIYATYSEAVAILDAIMPIVESADKRIKAIAADAVARAQKAATKEERDKIAAEAEADIADVVESAKRAIRTELGKLQSALKRIHTAYAELLDLLCQGRDEKYYYPQPKAGVPEEYKPAPTAPLPAPVPPAPAPAPLPAPAPPAPTAPPGPPPTPAPEVPPAPVPPAPPAPPAPAPPPARVLGGGRIEVYIV